ncbi:MAG: hypothetical protein ACPF9D_11890, partial [Owenweeksia sp.]
TILTGNILLPVFLNLDHYSLETLLGFLAITSLYSLHLLFFNFLFYWITSTFKPFPPYNYLLGGLYGLLLGGVHTLILTYFFGDSILQLFIPFIIMAPISGLLVELMTYRSG